MADGTSENCGAADSLLLASALAGNRADYVSTKQAIKEGRRETNPSLGERPSDNHLRNYFLAIGAADAALAAALPKDLRRPILAAVAGVGFSLAQQNNQRKKFDSFVDAMKKPAIIGALTGLTAMAMNLETSTLSPSATKQGGPAITFQKQF